MKRAVVFGAGNIGRGFLGQLFHESGYVTVFVDVLEPLVEALNARGEYPVRIVDRQTKTLTVRNVRALHSNDLDAVATELAAADIAATAVGGPVLPHIAPALASGIARRFVNPRALPLNIIVCENLIHAGPHLRALVQRYLDPSLHGLLEERVGFVEASIGRMVPVMTPEVRAEDPLLIEVEAYCELPVDADGFRGPVPDIAHLLPLPNFGAIVERKLYVHNAGHASAAYLGYLRRCEFVWQAVEDPFIRRVTRGAMSESCLGLSRKHGVPLAELQAHAEDLLRRFHNKALGDQVARVAKDPMRKLGPEDRLIGAARMCLEQGVEPSNLALACAAALRFDDPNDPSAVRLQAVRAESGDEGVLTEVCRLSPGHPLRSLILSAAERLSVGLDGDGLDLDQHVER
ncbi:MAG: mannitol dehydrogenase [Armatimonadetes bacterium]|nr:mannitol dehydrogenase [Armatimonadota bacterium]